MIFQLLKQLLILVVVVILIQELDLKNVLCCVKLCFPISKYSFYPVDGRSM